MSLATFSPRELRRFTQTFEDLFYAADPVTMTSYYTEHAQLMADGIQPLQGHAAITGFWHAAITRAAAARAQRTIRLHESHHSGDLGYALCTVTVDIPSAGRGVGADGTTIAVWDATIWQRDPPHRSMVPAGRGPLRRPRHRRPAPVTRGGHCRACRRITPMG